MSDHIHHTREATAPNNPHTAEEMQSAITEIAQLEQKVAHLTKALDLCGRIFVEHGLSVYAEIIDRALAAVGEDGLL